MYNWEWIIEWQDVGGTRAVSIVNHPDKIDSPVIRLLSVNYLPEKSTNWAMY